MYIGSPFMRPKWTLAASHAAFCESREYDDDIDRLTDRRTPDSYITFSAGRGQIGTWVKSDMDGHR